MNWKKMRIDLSLKCIKLGFTLVNFGDVCRFDKMLVFLHHVIKCAAQLANLIVVKEMGAGRVITL